MQAKIAMGFAITDLKGDTVVQDRYVLASPIMRDSVIEDFFDIQRIALKPGKYNAYIELQDLVSKQPALTGKLDVDVPNLAENIQLSSIMVAEVATPSDRYGSRTGPLNVLVVGGSLGAAALNTTIPKALALLDPSDRPHVIHQSGEKHVDALKQTYESLGVQAEVVPFIEDMTTAYANADLVICRAGAMTVAELSAVGVASYLVPFPHAVDDHQTFNAKFLSDVGAAVLKPQTELTAEGLAEDLKRLNRQELQKMAEQALLQAKPQATEDVANVCKQLCKEATRP